MTTEQSQHELTHLSDQRLKILVVQLTGKPPKVRFESYLEREAFTLHASVEQIYGLIRYILREVDIEAVVERDPDGSIRGGRIVSFEPVDVANDGDPWPAWEQWFREVNRED